VIPRAVVASQDEEFEERDHFAFFVLGLLSAADRVRAATRDDGAIDPPPCDDDRFTHFVLGLRAMSEALFDNLPDDVRPAPPRAVEAPAVTRILR
jgi:hypothetical protein